MMKFRWSGTDRGGCQIHEDGSLPGKKQKIIDQIISDPEHERNQKVYNYNPHSHTLATLFYFLGS